MYSLNYLLAVITQGNQRVVTRTKTKTCVAEMHCNATPPLKPLPKNAH